MYQSFFFELISAGDISIAPDPIPDCVDTDFDIVSPSVIGGFDNPLEWTLGGFTNIITINGNLTFNSDSFISEGYSSPVEIDPTKFYTFTFNKNDIPDGNGACNGFLTIQSNAGSYFDINLASYTAGGGLLTISPPDWVSGAGSSTTGMSLNSSFHGLVFFFSQFSPFNGTSIDNLTLTYTECV